MIQIKHSKTKKFFGNTLFNMISVGRAFELLRDDHMKHLTMLQNDMHFKYCRFHGLFHDEMAVVRRQQDGKLAFQWHQIDKITDNLLSIGLKPFWELASMPEIMASAQTYTFKWKMNNSEPKDYNEWAQLVEAFTSHMVDRYGLEEVRTWYFEVWNEPDLKSFWPAGMQRYNVLYEYAARAVKRVDKELKVGGPAAANGTHVKEFLDNCIEKNVPIDFITSHAYPQGDYCEYEDRKGSPYIIGKYVMGKVEEVNEIVKNSALPELEVHWTEWNTQSAKDTASVIWLFNEAVDSLFGGSCVINNMLSVKDKCDSIAYWVASDIFEERGLPNSPFSFTYGLVNIHGIKKATYNAYKLLRKMHGYEMDCRNNEETPVACGIAATEENEMIRVLMYNSALPEFKTPEDWKVDLEIDIKDGAYIVTEARIEKDHGSPYEKWIEMGMPQNLSRLQEEMLGYFSNMRYDFSECSSYDGVMKYSVDLKPNDVLYIEIQKKDVVATPTSEEPEKIEMWNKQLMLTELG